MRCANLAQYLALLCFFCDAASTRRRRRRGGFCSRLLLLLTIGLICSAFISAGSTVLALTVAANLMHSAVAGIRHLPTSAQGFAAWRQQALGPGLDNAVNHMTGVYQSEWFRTLESLECEDLKPTCQARRWTVHKARVGKVLGLDAWRVAKEHAPLAWENIVLPSAAFARHQGVLAWQQLKELKNEAGRAALVASVRRSAQDAKRLGLDLVEWAHCVVPHVSTSGWKSLDQVAGSCWQEKMGHYLGDGETTPPAAGGDDAGAAAHAAAPALKEDVLEEKGTDIEEKEEAPLSSPVDSGNAGNEDVSSTGDGKDTTMPDAVPEVPKEEASQAPAAPVAPDDVPSNATAPRKEEERDAPDVGAPAEDSKAAFEVVEDTFKQEIDPIEMDIEGSAPLNTSATPLASSAETEPSSPEDVTVDALPVAQPEAVDEVPLKAAPAPKEPLIKVANASAPVPVRVPATPAKVSEEPMLEEEATETPSAVNATAPEEVLEDPMLEEKAPEAPGEVNATSPVPSNATEAEEKVDVRPPGASSGSIQEVVPVAGAKEEEAASIEVGGSTGDVQRLYEEEYVVGRDGTADGEPRAEVNPGSKPVGEIKPRDEDLGSTSHGQDIKEKQEEGVEKSEGDEHDEQYDDYLPEMWDEEESYGEDDFHSIDDSEALNGGTEVLATEKQEPAAVNEVTASEETEEPKAAAVDEVNASEEPKEQEAAAVEVMESPEEQIVPVAQQSPALDEAAIEPASQPAPKPAAGEEEVHVKEGPSAMEKFSSQATELAQTLKEAAGEALAAAQWRMQTLTSQAMVHTAVVREYLAANGGTVVTAIVAVGATSAAFLLGSASARRARAVPAGAAAVVEPVTPRRAARAAPALEKEPEGEEGEGEPTTAWKSAKSGSVLGNIFGSGSKAPGEQGMHPLPVLFRPFLSNYPLYYDKNENYSNN